MAQRRESVLLSLEDQFTSEMVKAAAATALLKRELKDLSGTSVQTSRTTATISRDVDRMSSSAGKADKSINQLTGRLRLFADAAAVLGPSLVPIGAVAVPAITGLANQIGFAAAAAGVAVVAFQGVGDALTAANDYAIAPTTDNLAKLQEAMAMLSPSGQSLVQRLSELTGSLRELSHVAQSEMFPGLIDGIDALDALGPQVTRTVSTIARAVGDIASVGGDSLASERWSGFFDMLERDARPTLTTLASTIGDLTHGLAEMWIAFQPLNMEFGQWLRETASDFDAWASRLSQTQGFNEFMDYIRTNGPVVGESLRSVGRALLDIIEAVAPLGGPSLQLLQAFAETVSLIADSNLGPVIASLAALNALTSRMSPAFNSLSSSVSSARTGFAGLRADLSMMRGEYARVGASQAVMMSALSGTTGAAQRTRQALGKMASASAPIAGLGIAMSGLGRDTEYANTAMLGAAGLMMGPWGGAIGAGVGYLLDFSAGQKATARDTSGLTASLDQQTGALTENSAAWIANEIGSDRLEMFKELGISISEVVAAVTEGGPALERINELISQRATGDTMFGMASAEANALSMFLASLSGDVEETRDEFTLMREAADGGVFLGFAGGVEVGIDAVVEFSEALRDNIEAIRAQREEALKSSNANLAYSQALLNSKEAVKEYGGILKGTRLNQVNLTEDQIKARKALNDQAGAWNNLSVQAQNAPGAYKQARQALMQTARDMGYTEGQAKRLANQYMEIPEKRATKVALEGAAEAITAAGRVGSALDFAARNRTAYIGVAGPGVGAGAIGRATGGPIYGPGTETSDSIPALLSHNEHVWSAREVRAIGGHDAMERARAMARAGALRFANGGTPASRGVGPALAASAGVTTSGLNIARELRFVGMGLKELRKELKASTKSIDGLKDVRSGLRADRDALVSSLQSNYRTSLTGETGGAFTGVNTSPLATLNADIANLQALNKVRTTLSKKGLKRDALDAVLQEMSLGDLTAMTGWSDAEVKKVNSRYNERNALLYGKGSVPTSIGRDLYGPELKDLNKEIRSGNRTQNRMERALNAIQKNTKDAPKNTAKANAAASKRGAKRDRRNRR